MKKIFNDKEINNKVMNDRIYCEREGNFYTLWYAPKNDAYDRSYLMKVRAYTSVYELFKNKGKSDELITGCYSLTIRQLYNMPGTSNHALNNVYDHLPKEIRKVVMKRMAEREKTLKATQVELSEIRNKDIYDLEYAYYLEAAV